MEENIDPNVLTAVILVDSRGSEFVDVNGINIEKAKTRMAKCSYRKTEE